MTATNKIVSPVDQMKGVGRGFRIAVICGLLVCKVASGAKRIRSIVEGNCMNFNIDVEGVCWGRTEGRQLQM